MCVCICACVCVHMCVCVCVCVCVREFVFTYIINKLARALARALAHFERQLLLISVCKDCFLFLMYVFREYYVHSTTGSGWNDGSGTSRGDLFKVRYLVVNYNQLRTSHNANRIRGMHSRICTLILLELSAFAIAKTHTPKSAQLTHKLSRLFSSAYDGSAGKAGL